MSSQPFGSAVASFYEQRMVPMVFEPYASDLLERLTSEPLGDVLETAAGTGVVTRKLAALTANAPTSITATDFSQAMLDQAKTVCPDPRIRWQQADAQALPFADASFDLVFCQFGAMFFRDRASAYREARRVLRPGGRFLFSTWDSVATNELAAVAGAAVAALFPGNAPTFLERIPHGYFDHEAIVRDLAQAGFEQAPSLDTVVKPSHAESARLAAEAFVRGTPMRVEIEERDASRLEEVTRAAERALTERFGAGPITGRMQAIVVTARR